ncbi:hypothetical protein GCM10009678_55610 [Actinomadura kijaniata]|uniref:Uncharacterized protein n=1 Tax=Actinomadura namibiensis TaxID=182080 RepID=A0A7W3LLF9_ACTNM|nr:hypothetical protein [Actinomadura namibiensis]MBA8950222.1 hypothetical protein [Actinomadura namibiensis]
MTARVITLRPRPIPGSALVPSPSPSSSLAVLTPVRIDWDAVRSLYVARCSRCVDAFAAFSPDQVDRWAAAHRCDVELVALLASLNVRDTA